MIVTRPSWRMREEGAMLAFVAECPDCHNPASGVVSSDVLQSPLRELPEVFCSKCRKRFRGNAKDFFILPVNATRCR
ncbi:MAG TPA: hypothetical protein VES66_01915 [Terriglobales bacterium]|nr:hypothetical protein [Terriglobales bacterium]